MFTDTISLFDTYYVKLDKSQVPGFNKNLGREVRERFQQLSFLVNGVRTRQAEDLELNNRWLALCRGRSIDFSTLDRTKLPPDLAEIAKIVERSEGLVFEMKLFTESFYYLAGRLRTLLRHKSRPLPGLETFECRGVRDVRNKLLEHAEGTDSQISIRSWGFSRESGPVLKAVRYDHQQHVFPDSGLFTNANEIKVNLDTLLRAQLNELQP